MRNEIIAALAVAALAVVAACSGGAPGTPYPANPGVGSASLTSGNTITIPQATGLAVGSASLSGTGTVTASQSVSNPRGTAVLSLGSRTVHRAETGANTPICYVTFTAASAATISSVSLQVAPSSPPPAGSYYVAYWNGTQWLAEGLAGSVSSSGVISVNTGTISPAIKLSAGQSIYFAVYSGAFLTPNPSPPVASPNPIPVDLLSSTTVNVATNAGLTVTATSANTHIATVTASATANPQGEAPFTVDGVNSGSTTITFTDPVGQKTTDTVNVSDNLPSPAPSPAGFVISAGDSTSIVVTTVENVKITASSADTAVATITGSAQSNSSGQATFTVTGVSSGTAKLTFTDPYGDSDSTIIDVSPVRSGSFTSSNGTGTLGAWSGCSFAHSAIGTPVSPSPQPYKPGGQSGTPVPAMTPPGAADLVGVVTPPNYVEDLSGTFSTLSSPYSVPSQIGSNVAITGGSPPPAGDPGGEVASETNGAAGICQTLTLDSTNKYLTFWVYEAGWEYYFDDYDQEADVLNSSGTALYSASSILFAELNCFVNPGYVGITGYTKNHCIPNSLGGYYSGTSQYFQGGFWTPRGPYDISQIVPVGDSYTLFLGVFDNTAEYGNDPFPATYGNGMFISNVEMTDSDTFPSAGPFDRRRSLTLTLPRGRAQAASSAKAKP